VVRLRHRWVVPQLHHLRAAVHGANLDHVRGAKPIGTPDAGAFWRVISQHGRGGVLHRANRVSRPSARKDPDGKIIRQTDLFEIPHAVLPANGADPPTVDWRRSN